MGKASVILYISVGILVLFLVSYSPKKKTDHDHNYGGHNQHHRLKLRSSFNFKPTRHDPVPFDPLVAEMERRREDKEWERQYIEHSHPELVSHHQNVTTGSDGGGHDHAPGHESQPEWEDFMDAEDYLNDEEKFNVTDRLMLLFPKIDVSPSDGFVTVSELTEWTMQSSEKEVMHRTQRDMDVHDRNKDGFISFSEYEPPSWVRNANNNSFGYDMGWWKEEHFNASDADGDGLLNLTEFNDFLHPADTKNPKLLLWLCKEEVRERDSDKDGKISFEEFFHGLFDTVRNYEEDNNNSTHPFHDLPEGPAKQLFAQLDKDDDGYLSDTELLPVISKIHPTELYYAKQQADYIISQADSNKDGQLTLVPFLTKRTLMTTMATTMSSVNCITTGLVQYKFKKHPSKNRVQYQSLPRRSSGDLEVRRVFTIRKIRKDYTFFESCSVVIETCSIYVWFTLNTFEGYFFISKAYEGKQCYTCKGDKRQVLIHKTEIPDRKKLERVS